MRNACSIALLGLTGVASAVPSVRTARTLHYRQSNDSCYVTSYDAIPAAKANCTAITLDGVAVPGGVGIDLSGLKTGTTVTFAGVTTFAYANANVDLITVSGSDLTITAEPDAIIDGNGQAWWDGLGSNGGRTKPNHFFSISKALGNSVIRDLYIQNWPVHCFSVSNSVGLIMENITLNNTAGNAPNNASAGLPAAHNSDGFDLSGCNNTIVRSNTVLNQDDCVAITSGSNITVSDMYCDGGHGLSIGSVGGKSNNNVTNILFENSQILNSENGARIKTNSNTTGFISGITYQNIYVENISIYGVDIQQDYLNGGPTGLPTNGVIIQDITIKNVTGTANAKARDYYILCGDGSCANFDIEDVHITGGGIASACNFGVTEEFPCTSD